MSLNYTDNKIEGRVRISPSSLFTLYDNPNKWWNSQVLGKKDVPDEKIIIGNLIHNRIERFFKELEVDYDEENEYMQKFSKLPNINDWNVSDVLEETWQYLVKNHIPFMIRPARFEEYIQYIPKTNDKVFIGGTYDYMYQINNLNILGDYKTCTTLPKEIKTNHKLQLLAYAWILKLNGVKVDKIEITYIQRYCDGTISEKTGKKIGVKLPLASTISIPIFEEDFELIQKEIINVGKRVKYCLEDESMVELMFPTNYLSHF